MHATRLQSRKASLPAAVWRDRCIPALDKLRSIPTKQWREYRQAALEEPLRQIAQNAALKAP